METYIAKWLSEEALQIAVKRREVKSKGKKEKYSHLNAEFQRLARRDKKTLLSEQCKEIEEAIEWKKVMAPHSSTLAWKIPWTEEPGRLQSMGGKESDMTEQFHFHFLLFTFMHWRRKWQPTPVFLPGILESQGQEGLVGCRLWGHRESDTTEAT